MVLALIKHGGNLREAAKQYNIPLENWVDLSTGINPNGWLPAEIPTHVWQRLPEENDGLVEAAQQYYGVKSILPVAGSQAAIQTLPLCRRKSTVGIISPAYAEHAYCWRQAGHHVIAIQREQIEQQLSNLDVLIIINPNNPDTFLTPHAHLVSWHQQLAKKGGWLIVDEAFMDSTPKHSLLQQNLDTLPKLIVLRSLGKFFGLAGLRLGFVIAKPELLEIIRQKQGTWAISHPTRWIGKHALQDNVWQIQSRQSLQQLSQALQQCLSSVNLKNVKTTHLFCYIQLETAKELREHLAQHGIWVRYFDQPKAIRIGLPRNEKELNRLGNLLERFTA